MLSSWPAQQVAYIVFSGIGFILAYISLYWHFEAWNMGSVLWIFWSGTSCLIQFINAIIWRDNTVNWAPVWCDIATRFIHVQSIGIIVASVLINRRLYRIAKMRTVFTSRADRRRAGLFDLAIGLGIPATFVGLYWFVQGHRFDIIEGIGCIPATPNTTILLFTYEIWPIIILMISASYSVIAIHSFFRHREDLDLICFQSTSLASYRYFRLMLFASLDVLFLLPLNFYILYIGQQQMFYPWQGLANLHFEYSFVGQFPVTVWQSSRSAINQVLLIPCTTIAACCVFFAFFALAKDFRDNYYKAFRKLFQMFTGKSKDNDLDACKRGRRKQVSGSRLTVPSFIQRVRPAQTRHDSLSSTFSIAITVEGHTVYNDINQVHRIEDWEKSISLLWSDGACFDPTALDAEAAPAYPPGLSPVPLSHPREPQRHTIGVVCSPSPPAHTFDGPRSICFTSVGSIV